MQAIVAWCEALSGSISLSDALVALVKGLGAEAGMILRTHSSDNRPSRIALHDQAAGFAIRELKRSFADSYFGPVLEGARSGTIWQATALADDATEDPALGEWQASRRYREFVVLVLSTSAQQRDHIELHFRDELSAETAATIEMMMPTMARTWAARRVGLITRSIVNHRQPAPLRPNANLLGIENPARLSRAEFRVGLMLSRGLSVAATAQELALSEATVRSHLHAIYAKTGCSSLAELVYRLLTPQPEAAVPQARIA
jgi:DNA-binding CsgD family transcriptional regulator